MSANVMLLSNSIDNWNNITNMKSRALEKLLSMTIQEITSKMEGVVGSKNGSDGSSTNVSKVEEVKTLLRLQDTNGNPKGASHPPITATTTTSSIAIDWCPVAHNPDTIFEVKMKLRCAMEWTLVYYGKDTSLTVNGLPSGTNTAISIRAINQGTNGWSSIALYNTLPSPPDAPTTLVASYLGARDVELQWQSPLHDGGFIISGFRLEVTIQPRARTRQEETFDRENQVSNQVHKFVLIAYDNNPRFFKEGLELGATYCFRVQALNQLGYGPYSEPALVQTPTLRPATPEPPIVVGKTSKFVSLRWASPPCNGATIESFTLQLLFLGYGEKCLPINLDLHGTNEDELEQDVAFERSVDSPGLVLTDIYSGPSNEFVVKKLRLFSTYAFRVKAQNAVGTSGFSAFSTCMTVAGAPCAPAGPTVVETNLTSLTLNWEIPELDNGSPVLRYTLEMQKVEINTRNVDRNKETPDGGKKAAKRKWAKPAQLTSRVWVVVYEGLEFRSQVSDLEPGNEYSFRVKARNALGTSAPSSTLVAFTLPTAPCAPLPPTFGRVTPTTAQIKWAAPACDNGMPVTSYKLMLDDGQGGSLQQVYEGEVRNFHASKLVPSSSYRAAVQAINACGASELSEEAVVEVPDEMPAEEPIAPPIAPPSPATVADDLPSNAIEVVARKKTKPAPAAVEAKASTKEKAVSAPAKANEEPTAAESIKSTKEVKGLMRLKARQAWRQRVSRALIQTSWHVQQLWPLWALLVFVAVVASMVVQLSTSVDVPDV